MNSDRAENKYNDDNLKIVKHEIIIYNPYISNIGRKKQKHIQI